MKKNTADKILQETELGYDLIAQKFSQTRKHFWRELEFIKDFCKEGDNVLDFGCGNGRLLNLIEASKINYWGVDVSEKLIEHAKSQHVCERNIFQKINPIQNISSTNFGSQHIKGSGKDGLVQEEKKETTEQKELVLDTPFADKFFNTIYSIAVFHHFPSKKYRQDVANDLYRITADGGHVVVTVWHLWQKKYRKNILKNWKEKFFETVFRMSGIRSAGLRSDSGVNNLDWNDCHISFEGEDGKKFQRFHHAFTKRELRKLFESAGFETEKCEVADGRNILYIGKK
jgi:SAM-dependent methyltransferase